jgi:16S rRNA processing protein RimM
MNALVQKHSSSTAREDMVCLGAVFGAAGVKGALRLKVFTENLKSISEYGPVTVYAHDFPKGKQFAVKILHSVKGGLAVKLNGIDDRNMAESLKGAELYIDRSALPELEEKDGFYFDDLIGLAAKDQSGYMFGKVEGVFNFGAGDIVEVNLSTEKGKRMYPFSDKIVPEVNIEAGYIIINRDAFENMETKEKG